MHFSLSPAIFAKYPALQIGLLICRGLKNGPASPEVIALLRDTEAKLKATYQDPEALKAHPAIAVWQEAHRAFGSNPNKFPSSVHALCKRVVKGGELPQVNTLVDLYNIVSLRHMLPVGGEDLDRCSGDITLTFAEGTELFTPLGSSENEPPEPGEAIYRDTEGVLCRKFNWREAARTCLTEKTANAVLVIEAISPTTREMLDAALMDIEALVKAHCNGEVRREILDASHLSAAL